MFVNLIVLPSDVHLEHLVPDRLAAQRAQDDRRSCSRSRRSRTACSTCSIRATTAPARTAADVRTLAIWTRDRDLSDAPLPAPAAGRGGVSGRHARQMPARPASSSARADVRCAAGARIRPGRVPRRACAVWSGWASSSSRWSTRSTRRAPPLAHALTISGAAVFVGRLHRVIVLMLAAGRLARVGASALFVGAARDRERADARRRAELGLPVHLLRGVRGARSRRPRSAGCGVIGCAVLAAAATPSLARRAAPARNRLRGHLARHRAADDADARSARAQRGAERRRAPSWPHAAVARARALRPRPARPARPLAVGDRAQGRARRAAAAGPARAGRRPRSARSRRSPARR